jgi:translation elongation factor EF-Tu-like GTPase
VAAVASFLSAVLTEIYLCNVCSCPEILRRNGRGQVRELLDFYDFDGDNIPVVKGSALCALNSTDDKLGKEAILELINVSKQRMSPAPSPPPPPRIYVSVHLL